jgi:tetratricopeptide (TPR) repeat protein
VTPVNHHSQRQKKESTSNIILVVFLLTASIIISYCQVTNHDFVSFDDLRYVKRFEHEGISISNVINALTSFDLSNWHPLTWLSHMTDVHLFGMNPGAHHIVSVFFHIANTLLLFIVFNSMTDELWKSCFVAGLFALHPLHVESVAWVAERKDVLSTMFLLLTIFMYIQYTKQPGFRTYIPMICFYFLGLLSKPMVVTLPFMLLLLDIWPLCRIAPNPQSEVGFSQIMSRLPRLFFEKTPLLVLASTSCIITIVAQKSGGALGALDAFSLNIRAANALTSYIAYIAKMFVPIKLAVFYPYPSFIPAWKIIGASVLLAFISFFVLKAFKAQPYLAIGWFWYLGTLVPVIGLVQVGTQAMADRYTYIPLVGLFIMIVWGFPQLVKRWKYKKHVIIGVSLSGYSVLAVITWFQVGHWSDNFSLYQHAIHVTQNNHVAHNNLGAALYQAGKRMDATGHFMRALEIKPDYHEALTNFYTALHAGRSIDQAIDIAEKLLTIYPRNSSLYYTLGVLYGQKGALSHALEKYQQALIHHPKFAQAQFDLAHIYALLGDDENALQAYRRVVEIQSDLVWAYYNAAAILAADNRVDEAILWIEKAVSKGFSDWEYLENDARMKPVRATLFYQNLLLDKRIK